MTTKTRRSAPSDATVRSETLAGFSALIDEHAGREVGFAQVIHELHRVRTQHAGLKAARAGVYEHVKRAYEIGHRVLSGPGLQLHMSTPGAVVRYQAAESATVKKADPRAWERAKAPTRYVRITAPRRAAVKLIPAPDGSGFMPPDEAAAVYKNDPAWAMLKALSDIEYGLVARLERIADEFNWDGMLTTFADGWAAQLRRVQFSSERLAEIDPETFAKLAVIKTRQTPARVLVRPISADMFDEIDGD